MATAFQANAFQTNAFQIDVQVENPPAVGNAGAIFASWEHARPRRSAEEVQRDRERFGLPKRADDAIEEVLARQEELDAQAAEEALRQELKLQRIAFRTKYMEALAARMQAAIAARKTFDQQQRNAMLLMLIAAAV